MLPYEILLSHVFCNRTGNGAYQNRLFLPMISNYYGKKANKADKKDASIFTATLPIFLTVPLILEYPALRLDSYFGCGLPSWIIIFLSAILHEEKSFTSNSGTMSSPVAILWFIPKILLYGDNNLPHHINREILQLTLNYIHDSK